jgi:putative two-component system response regulator
MDDKNTILLVDDESSNLELLKAICGKMGFLCITAGNGHQALEQVRLHHPDLVLMDVAMPGMDGFTATGLLKGNPHTAHIPVILVTALGSRQDRIEGIDRGANDFLTKPFDSEELSLRIRNNLKLKEYQDLLKNHNRLLEQQVGERTAELENTLKELDRSYRRIKQGYLDTVLRLTMAIEYKDGNTGNHIQRTSHLARALATEMRQHDQYSESLYYAASMHDIGKVGIPDSILTKPGPLDQSEWEVMKTHTTIGANILKGSESPIIKMAEEIALTHHERWDGSGYPNKLTGIMIPLSGRIVSIIDQYDAIRSARSYKPTMEHKEACQILNQGDKRSQPGHFDPEVLDVFNKNNRLFQDIYQTYIDMNTDTTNHR